MLRSILPYVDFAMSMSYDSNGAEHSSLDMAKKTIANWFSVKSDAKKLLLGVPFYGRNSQTSDWKSYEDLIQNPDPAFNYNDVEMIKQKTQLAKHHGLGGMMIWEVGQDCRVQAHTRDGVFHKTTCPRKHASSLMVAIATQIEGVLKVPAQVELWVDVF